MQSVLVRLSSSLEEMCLCILAHVVVAYCSRKKNTTGELKHPVGVWKAYSQLKTHKDEISDLFGYNVALVINDGITARVGSLTANKERFMPWNTIKNEDDRPLLEYQLEKVVRGFFDPELFLCFKPN